MKLVKARLYVVQNKQIKVRVLIFVKHMAMKLDIRLIPQFEGATLKSMTKLDRDIDGFIATLSHWALEKMAKLALYLRFGSYELENKTTIYEIRYKKNPLKKTSIPSNCCPTLDLILFLLFLKIN